MIMKFSSLFFAVMGGEQAANVLASVQRENIESEGRSWSAEEEQDFKLPILNKYEKESSALYSTARLWDDGIIHPADTRKVRNQYCALLLLLLPLLLLLLKKM